MSIQNLDTYDPFADAAGGKEEGVQDGLVHIRIQQRNGRKTLTTVQGLSAEYDLKKIVRACKKEFACNGTVVEHSEYGEMTCSAAASSGSKGPARSQSPSRRCYSCRATSGRTSASS